MTTKFKESKGLLIMLIGLLIIIGIIRFFNTPELVHEPTKDKDDFISVNKEGFHLNDTLFYPLTLNYKVSLQGTLDDIWPCSYVGYDTHSSFHYNEKDSSLAEMLAEMKLIRSMGFNSIRVVGIGEPYYEYIDGEPVVSIGFSTDSKNNSITLNNDKNYEVYLGAIEQLFATAAAADLKVILLVQMKMDYQPADELLRRIAYKFYDNTTILAYDLFNEPLYFDSAMSTKPIVYPVVEGWNKIVKENAPYHLTTIGLSGIREVFGWDPNILAVDFISYHPYEYEKEQVSNELYWYGKVTKKPWMIGETSLPADNDSVPYRNQELFAEKTLKRAHDCGAIGYSWWQFKDVSWGEDFHQNFMGVVNQHGKTNVDGTWIYGTPKPVQEAFQKFDPSTPRETPAKLDNYYNYSQHAAFRIKGKLVDGHDHAIKDGVLLTWNEWWSDSYHTITKEDGTFELLSDFPLYHWMISAVGQEMIRDDVDPSTAVPDPNDGIPTIDLGTLKIDRWNAKKPVSLTERIKNLFSKED